MIQIDLSPGEYLTEREIVKIIKDFEKSPELKRYYDNEKYFKGKNPTILRGTLATLNNTENKNEAKTPDNRIPVPYGRKLSLTTKNYMFNRPVNYIAEDKTYTKKLNDIFYINNNYKKTNRVGLDLIVHGYSYLLFYVDIIDGENVPQFSVINQNELIPIYDRAIEPKLTSAIRYYSVDRSFSSNVPIWYVEVYYGDVVKYYQMEGQSINESIALTGEKVHAFPSVPVIVYGDDYKIGVFEAVKALIDGLDLIISMNLNEIEKFALAYLILKGQIIKTEDMEKVKKSRVFQLSKESSLEYLTKNLDYDFNKSVEEFLVDEIHKQSGVPDFASKEFSAESGIALQYKLMGFENLASDIEATFHEGETKKINMINSVIERTPDSVWNRIQFWKKNPDKTVTIKMSRNLPEDTLRKLEEAEKMKTVGVSKETIFEYLPMIPDAESELERVSGEQEKQLEYLEREADLTEPQIEEPEEINVA